MAITTEEFELRLNELLASLEEAPRCEWCGCDGRQRRKTVSSKICESCKKWKLREQRAEEMIKQNPDRANTVRFRQIDYNIEYASLCREEGGMRWRTGPVTPIDLQNQVRSISERLCGEDIFGDTTYYFGRFSKGQQQLLMFLFKELNKVWVRNRRRSFAIDNVVRKQLSRLG